jgi:hypothetical protein
VYKEYILGTSRKRGASKAGCDQKDTYNYYNQKEKGNILRRPYERGVETQATLRSKHCGVTTMYGAECGTNLLVGLCPLNVSCNNSQVAHLYLIQMED